MAAVSFSRVPKLLFSAAPPEILYRPLQHPSPRAGSHTVFLYAFETAFWHLQKLQTLCSAFSEPLPTYGARKPPCFLAPSMAAVSFCRVPKLLLGTFKSLKPSAAPSEMVYRPLEPVPAATQSRCEAAFWHRPWPTLITEARTIKMGSAAPGR